MSKDPRRYTPQPYGHAAPWSRRAAEEAAREAPAPVSAPARRLPAATPVSAPATRLPAGTEVHGRSPRWPLAVLVALILVGVGWLVYDTAVS